MRRKLIIINPDQEKLSFLTFYDRSTDFDLKGKERLIYLDFSSILILLFTGDFIKNWGNICGEKVTKWETLLQE